jgi:hypothetical protein
VTEELRTLLRSELSAERPPPLDDLVDVAIRDGRRIRRVRRLGLAGAGAAVLGVIALTATLAGPFGPAGAPGRVQVAAPPSAVADQGERAALPPAAAPLSMVPPTAVPASTPFPVAIDGLHARGRLEKATGPAMLQLLTMLLPPGKTSNYAAVAGGNQHVQLFLDTGQGPGMIRAALERDLSDRSAKRGMAWVTVDYLPDNCVRSIVVDAALPDGANLVIDIAGCLTWDGKKNAPAPQALTVEQAVKIVADPRWGLQMDAGLVATGQKRFPDLPTIR